MKTAFIITSAINTKFGVFTAEQRLEQTLATIASVRAKVPDAKIIAVEMAGISPTPEQRDTMIAHTDLYVDLSTHESVKAIYESTDNWDIVKNTTEVMCFTEALQSFIDFDDLKDIDRVFKLSGRYTLSDSFDITQFEKLPDRIVVGRRRYSQFPENVTGGIKEQFMSRLWSWPNKLTPLVIDAYTEGFAAMAQRLNEGGYFDIEHMLFKYLPADLVSEVDRVGVRGNLGPNGTPVED